MFTGIVEETGRVRRCTRRAAGAQLVIAAGRVLDDVFVGASIAVNGACLTVVAAGPHEFVADVVPETLARTNLGALSVGDLVNLERPLAADGRFGGHVVLGHVDATVALRDLRRDDDGGAEIDVEIPSSFEALVLEKGSIALDGVSLTVASVAPGRCRVALIPHTMAVTTLGERRPGDRVNLEVDYLAKIVARLGASALEAAAASAGPR
jgi:riboflavin synthase